ACACLDVERRARAMGTHLCTTDIYARPTRPRELANHEISLISEGPEHPRGALPTLSIGGVQAAQGIRVVGEGLPAEATKDDAGEVGVPAHVPDHRADGGLGGLIRGIA